MSKMAYLYDFMILLGLTSLGVGLFFVFGTGITMAIMGAIVFILGAFGHSKVGK